MNNINEIESLTWDQAQKMATEIISIKGHCAYRFGRKIWIFSAGIQK